jgi:predicted CopG family antitoxin
MDSQTEANKFERQNTPSVKFELPDTEYEAGMFFYFCFKKDGLLDWSERVYAAHPKLKEMTVGVVDGKEFLDMCKEYVSACLKEQDVSLQNAKEHFQLAWDKIAETFLREIIGDFETQHPENIDDIVANVSINPICPRHIKDWSYSLFYKFSAEQVCKTSIHEIIHFFYFKKWLEVFPGYDTRTFENPHSEWILSEILVVVIMNQNKKIQEILKGGQSDVYKEFQHIKIGDKSLVDFFGEIYRKHTDSQMSFEDFLKKSWEEYNKHRGEIEVKKNIK